MRGALACLGALLILATSAPVLFGTSQTFTNDTGEAVIGIRLTFSDMVWITSHDKTVFATQAPVGVSSKILFSGGQLASLGQFRVTWGETYVTILSFEWLRPSGSSSLPSPAVGSSGQASASAGTSQTPSATALARSGFSLLYDVDLTDPSSHRLFVTLTIHTKGIRSLSLSTSRYHPVATANTPEDIAFEAMPAQGFSVEDARRAHTDPHGKEVLEPAWRLSFEQGATITIRYGRTFTRTSELGGNGVTAYLDRDLFLATGERYFILPELMEGHVWSGSYADRLQGIAVRYRLPNDWAIWTPWNPLPDATFDTCTYEGTGAASTNLTCLVMSTVIAGPQASLAAKSRVFAGTEVTLVFSRRMRNLDQRSEDLFRAFESVQNLWGEAVDARYLAAFPVTPYPLYSGEWANSQGYSVNQTDAGDDLWKFLHQIHHRWNGFGVLAARIGVAGWAYKFYGEAWNCYYQDKILNQLRASPARWAHCRQWYAEYLSKAHGRDAPVADALQPGLTSEQSDWIAYCKGALVAYLLDREIERLSQGRYSLDDVVKEIWAKYGNHQGVFTYDDVKAILLRLTGEDFAAFFDAYVFGTARLTIPELR